MPKGHLPVAYLACLILALTACSVGPKYQRPEARAPAAYKESLPASFKEVEGWKVAQPNDAAPRGSWWEICGAPQVNALEEQVDISKRTALDLSTRRMVASVALILALGGGCWPRQRNERLSTRRVSRSAPHPSPVEAA